MAHAMLFPVLVLKLLMCVSATVYRHLVPTVRETANRLPVPEWPVPSTIPRIECPDKWTCKGYNYFKIRRHYLQTHCACDRLCLLLQDCCPDAHLAFLPASDLSEKRPAKERRDFLDGVGVDDRTKTDNMNKLTDLEKSEKAQERQEFIKPSAGKFDHFLNDSVYRLKNNSIYTDYQLDKDMFSCIYDAGINGANNVSVVTRCPDDYDDEEVTQSCHNVTADDMMTRLPVSGRRTGVLYRNMFCALCHQEPFIYWAVGANCSSKYELPYDHNSTDLPQLLQPRSHCRVVFVPPADSFQWRPCMAKVVRSCNDSFPLDTPLQLRIVQGCEQEENSTQRMVFGFTKAYRNKYCALCNHEHPNFLSCNPSWDTSINPRPGTGVRNHFYSFSILLDINTNTGSTTVGQRYTYKTVQRNESVSCDEGQVFDPFRSTCRDVTCGPGRYFSGNTCQKKQEIIISDNSSTVINSNTSSILNNSQRSINPEQNSTTFLLHCDQVILLNQTEYRLFANGTLELLGTDMLYDDSQYALVDGDMYLCVNYSQNYTRTITVQEEASTFTFSLAEAVISTCGICISLLALAVTMFVYVSLRVLRNIPGQNLLSLVCSLFLADLLLLLSPLASHVFLPCAIIAGVMHYFFLASFLWMNVMAVDVWFTFSKAFVKAGDRGKSSKRFFMYSCYCWLTPLAFVLPALLVQVLKPSSPVSPRYGLGICWLGNKYALLLFFAAPLFFLLLLNIVFFLISARNISRARQTTARMLGKEEEGKMAIYVKLTVVMGITWVLGFLAALVPQVQALTYAFVIMNTLQGLFICLSFVFTKKVLGLLRDKFCGKRQFKVTKSGSTDLTNVSKSLSGNRKLSSASNKSHNVI